MAAPDLHGVELDSSASFQGRFSPVMADNANQQYDNPPFGTEVQSTGLGGSAGDHHANDQYAGGVDSLGIDPQTGSGAEALGTQNPGAHYTDQGDTAYTNPFSILNGSDTPQDHGSTGTVISSDPVYGEELTDTGLHSATPTAPAPGRPSASQASPWTKAGS
jgi:hypothetical protein